MQALTIGAREHFADRLCSAIESAGAPACVGLDPVLEKLPRAVRDAPTIDADAIEHFCMGVLEAIDGVIPAVKLQSACFERLGAPGFAVLERVANKAKTMGFIVIYDAKRGDIGVTAAHYTRAAFNVLGADAVTVNPYMGPDAIEAFLAPEYADRGVFALVRTSNPGSDAVQSHKLEDGRTVAQMIADHTATLGEANIGKSGYSNVGAVVAATKPEDAAVLRKRMPRQFFLVPGFGAQGGTAETVRALFNTNGQGALITASRSVIYGFEEGDADWLGAVRKAAEGFAKSLEKI